MLTHPARPSRARTLAVFFAAGVLCCPDPARAQQQDSNWPLPRLTTVFPCGAKAGTTVDVTLGGTDLEEPEKLVFSHAGIKAEPILGPAPPPADPKKPPMPPPKRPVTGFKVTVAGDAPLGCHDVRVVNKWGVSNPRCFVVGDLPEAVDKEPNNDAPQAQRIELNSTVSGNMANQVDVDYFVFAGKKAQRVVFSCLASSLDSRMNASLEIYDANNRLLTQNRSYKDRDALCDLSLPEDGDYYVRVFHFTHTAGNQEYFYRLTVSTAPWIDAIFPPMVEPGKATPVTVLGRNLPGGQPDPTKVVDDTVLEKIQVTVNAPSGDALAALRFSGQITPVMSGLDGFEYRTRNGTGASNPFFLTFARAPVVQESATNDTAETAQEITTPCELAGRIEKRRDRDWYSFAAKKGDVLNLELFSDRLGSPGDVYFLLRNPANKQTMAEQDDEPFSQGGQMGPLGPKFFARTDDPGTYRFTAPADGKYQLLIASRTDGLSGARNIYRMRIAPEQPDFRLVVLGGPDNYRPSSCCVGQGGNNQLRVLAWRRDGFNGEIALGVEGLPKGVTCPPQVLGPGLRHTALVFSAAADAPAWTGEIKVKGTATIGGKPVVREARPGSITWQTQPIPQFPRASRVDRALYLAVRDKAPWVVTATIDKPEVVQGKPAVITAKLTRQYPGFNQPVLLQANAQSQGQPPFLPQNLNLPQVNINAGQAEAKLNFTINPNTPPGTYNLVLRTQAQVNQFSKDPKNAKAPKQNILVVQPSSPVSLTVVPRSLAQVQVSVPQPNVKAGGQAEVVVRVNRQNDYAGEFKVKLEFPPNTGLSADEVTIPAGQNEAKAVVKVAAGAAPGARNNLTARATALWSGKTPVAQETKFNLNVVK